MNRPRIHIYANRIEAGRTLAAALLEKQYPNPVVIALPRGGVPIAAEVAKTLNAPLDLVLVRKIGVPWQPELALAAVVDGPRPELVINEDVRAAANVTDEEMEALRQEQMREIERRRHIYLQGREPLAIAGKTAIVIDDGIATGATMRAALKALRRAKPGKLVLAVPVAPVETVQRLRDEVDEVVCLQTPEPFYAIGEFYRDFTQMTDEDVVDALARGGFPAGRVRETASD